MIAPFVPPGGLDDAGGSALARAIALVPAFDVTFARVAWFGQAVLFLAPEPAGPFAGLTGAVWRAFPGHPPYREAHEEVVPHLTVGMGQPAAELARAGLAVESGLPVRSRVDMVTLMQGSPEPGSWQVVAEFPLGAAGSAQ